MFTTQNETARKSVRERARGRYLLSDGPVYRYHNKEVRARRKQEPGLHQGMLHGFRDSGIDPSPAASWGSISAELDQG